MKRIEKHYGQNIVCGHVFKTEEIKAGSCWQGSSGAVVEVVSVCPRGWITYKWVENGVIRQHEKDSFSFQCRYCLILDNQSTID